MVTEKNVKVQEWISLLTDEPDTTFNVKIRYLVKLFLSFFPFSLSLVNLSANMR